MFICARCGGQNRDTARFCRHCRSEITLRCSRCGAGNRPSARFCGQCRNLLITTSTGAAHDTGKFPPQFVIQGRYVIVRLIARGGMGAVYLVTDTRLPGQTWALKEMGLSHLLPADRPAALAAFRREAQLLATLDHVNLPKVTDYFEEQGRPYLVMDYVEGATLQDILEQRGPCAEAEVLEWAAQLCDVLEYLHSQNPPVIFRDLKPGNIMLTPKGQIKLIDFGIARHFDPRKKKDTMPLGTEGYAAPEQYGKGQSDARSDVYALGATLHHLLTDREPNSHGRPFYLPPVRSLNPKVSKDLEQVIEKATQPKPEDRYQSIAEMRQSLRKSPVKPAATPPPPAPPPPKKPPKPKPPAPVTNAATSPALLVMPLDLDLGTVSPGKTAQHTITVANTGGGKLTGSLKVRQPWLRADRLSFTDVTPDSPVSVRITVNTALLAPGQTPKGAIEVISNGGSATVDVRVAVTPATPSPASPAGQQGLRALLYVLAVFLPWVAIPLGAILWAVGNANKDDDQRTLGQNVLIVSVLVAGTIGCGCLLLYGLMMISVATVPPT